MSSDGGANKSPSEENSLLLGSVHCLGLGDDLISCCFRSYLCWIEAGCNRIRTLNMIKWQGEPLTVNTLSISSRCGIGSKACNDTCSRSS